VAYCAVSVQDIVDGIDEFLDELIVLPPSIWDPNTRLEPPLKSRAKVHTIRLVLYLSYDSLVDVIVNAHETKAESHLL